MSKFMKQADIPSPPKSSEPPVIDHTDTSAPWAPAPTTAIDVDSWRAGAKFATGAILDEFRKPGSADDYANRATKLLIKERDRLMALNAPTMAQYQDFTKSIAIKVFEFLDVDITVASLSDLLRGIEDMRQHSKIPKTATKDEIRSIFVANGFKTRVQDDGSTDLNPYVFDAAVALLAYVHRPKK